MNEPNNSSQSMPKILKKSVDENLADVKKNYDNPFKSFEAYEKELKSEVAKGEEKYLNRLQNGVNLLAQKFKKLKS